jgi:hypothetical protein
MTLSLTQSPFYQTLSIWKIRRTLELMQRPASQPLTYDVALDVCTLSQSKALLAGSIADIGNRYAIKLKAIDCQTKRVMATSSAIADDRSAVLKALGNACFALRQQLGEPSTTLAQFNRPLPDIGPSTLEASQEFQ